mmetsp:Transcript_38724/g.75607  ORF Transcript_38724/g.75607 Transcript_38724/m.75607 type:complete len:205 (-) Transcript_38724:545-1159(-)
MRAGMVRVGIATLSAPRAAARQTVLGARRSAPRRARHRTGCVPCAASPCHEETHATRWGPPRAWSCGAVPLRFLHQRGGTAWPAPISTPPGIHPNTGHGRGRPPADELRRLWLSRHASCARPGCRGAPEPTRSHITKKICGTDAIICHYNIDRCQLHFSLLVYSMMHCACDAGSLEIFRTNISWPSSRVPQCLVWVSVAPGRSG